MVGAATPSSVCLIWDNARHSDEVAFGMTAMSAIGTKQTCSMPLTNVRFWEQTGHLTNRVLTKLDL